MVLEAARMAQSEEQVSSIINRLNRNAKQDALYLCGWKFGYPHKGGAYPEPRNFSRCPGYKTGSAYGCRGKIAPLARLVGRRGAE